MTKYTFDLEAVHRVLRGRRHFSVVGPMVSLFGREFLEAVQRRARDGIHLVPKSIPPTGDVPTGAGDGPRPGAGDTDADPV